MYPYFRITKMLLVGRFKSKLTVTDKSVLKMCVWPGDIDVFLELNNGRHLTMMDFGRFDLAARSGLLKTVKENSWGLAVAGASVRYRHRLNLFQKYELHSEVIGHDDKWIYFHQKTIRKGRIHSAALIRTAVTSKKGIVKVEEVMKAIGHIGEIPLLPDWVKAWAEADQLRPWE
jgi:acyl-CoA thioesterase FadM